MEGDMFTESYPANVKNPPAIFGGGDQRETRFHASCFRKPGLYVSNATLAP